jgi:hypothetical protein
MEWSQVLTILASNLALFIWARTEANQDRRDMNDRLERALKAIHEEMKDFHARLCVIEDRRVRTEEK